MSSEPLGGRFSLPTDFGSRYDYAGNWGFDRYITPVSPYQLIARKRGKPTAGEPVVVEEIIPIPTPDPAPPKPEPFDDSPDPFDDSDDDGDKQPNIKIYYHGSVTKKIQKVETKITGYSIPVITGYYNQTFTGGGKTVIHLGEYGGDIVIDNTYTYTISTPIYGGTITGYTVTTTPDGWDCERFDYYYDLYFRPTPKGEVNYDDPNVYVIELGNRTETYPAKASSYSVQTGSFTPPDSGDINVNHGEQGFHESWANPVVPYIGDEATKIGTYEWWKQQPEPRYRLSGSSGNIEQPIQKAPPEGADVTIPQIIWDNGNTSEFKTKEAAREHYNGLRTLYEYYGKRFDFHLNF